MQTIITQDERELLKVLRQGLSSNTRPLGEDFYELLETYGINENNPLMKHFEELLLDDLSLMNTLLKLNNAINFEALINILNHYLNSISNILASEFEASVQNQYALNNLCKLSFSIIESYNSDSKNLLVMPVIDNYEANHLLTHAAFIETSGAILNTLEDITIIAIHFDFGSYSHDDLTILNYLISAKLCHSVRSNDLVGLLKSQHWVLLLRNVDHAELAVLAINKIKTIFRNPLQVNKSEIYCTPYFGVALSKYHEGDINQLIKSAVQMSAMSIQHKLKYQIFDIAASAENNLLNALSNKFRDALENNDLELFYQPKVCTITNKINGLEALLRWELKDKFVPIPVMFKLIDRNHLLESFTEWLIKTSLRNLHEFISIGMDIKLSINILPENLNTPDFSLFLSKQLLLWNVPNNRLVVEITENSIVENNEISRTTLNQLKKMGIKISTDDFGTGYSSLSLLSQFPIDEIKIDQSFIKNIQGSERDTAIVKTIIELANNFKLDLIAEGVESQEVSDQLKAMGCNNIQGFLISKPIAKQAIIEWFYHDIRNQWNRIS